MSASEAKSPPSQGDHQVSSPRSRDLLSQLQNFSEIVSKLRAHSKDWKAMNAGENSLSWRRRWRAAQASLETLRGLSEPSPSLAGSR